MGFFGSLWRLIRTCFGLGQGATERATDALLVSSPDTIRAQFRKTREDWQRDAEELKNAVAELRLLRDRRLGERSRIKQISAQQDVTMQQAVDMFKKTQEGRWQTCYAAAAQEKEKQETAIKAIDEEVAHENDILAQYQDQYTALLTKICDLDKEEAETVAEIVTAKKMEELDNRLSGLRQDTSTKNLQAIREAREKAKVKSAMALEAVQPSPMAQLNAAVNQGASQQKYLEAFNQQVGMDKLFPQDKAVEVKKLPATSVDQLFKE